MKGSASKQTWMQNKEWMPHKIVKMYISFLRTMINSLFLLKYWKFVEYQANLLASCTM